MQSRMNQQQPIERQFFSEQNELTLYKILATNFQQQTGIPLNDRQQSRLGKALEHYMREVFDVNGPEPLPQLNREVLAATTKDFQSYLRRDMAAPTLAASQQIVSDPANQPRAETAQQRLAIQQGLPVQPRPTFESNLLMDTSSRFEQMQQDRVPATQIRPIIPDFQSNLSSADTEMDPLALFESAKKAREEEAARMVKPVAASNAEGMATTDVNPLVRFMQPPSIQNDPQSNPTLAQPIAQLVPPVRGPLPQDYLIKQDDIINYKEVEYNLIVYSADRDWLNNNRENRYNFSINFDVGNNKQGFYFSPSSNKKFKNISRIELVKAIIPTEGLISLTQHTASGGGAYVNTAKLNALTYPYIILRVPELDVNNYGTDDNLNNAFGILQYDANWYSDTTNLEDGYLAMIPKFMKCQKVYQPTPLATLQKLTIELNTPEGQSLSDVSDTLALQNIYISSGALPAGLVSANYGTVTDINGNGEYLFIQTSAYFSKWQFAEGNRIAIQGLDPNQVPGGDTLAARNMLTYLQNPQGLPIIDIAYIGTPGGDGANSAGYANIIIVRAPHVDPTTGSVDVQPFGGSSAAMTALANAVNGVAVDTTTYTGAKLINLTHQTNLVFRIITRELDSAARVRPDNL